MNRRTKPDEKQRELPLFVEDCITVPAVRQLELEGALAELLLSAANTNKPTGAYGGRCESENH
jgi:hypothetical protein